MALSSKRYSLTPSDIVDIETLVAATEPPTDDEIAQAIVLIRGEMLPQLDRAAIIRAIKYHPDEGRMPQLAAIVRHFLGPVKP